MLIDSLRLLTCLEVCCPSIRYSTYCAYHAPSIILPISRRSHVEKRSSQTFEWLPNVVAFIVGCYAIFSQQTILDSSRPVLPTNSDVRSDDRAYARLWDDPFVAFPQDRSPGQSFNGHFEPQPILLVFVLLDSLSYAEDDEARLRTRYAVQKALADLDYIPENPEVLESVQYPPRLRPGFYKLYDKSGHSGDSQNQSRKDRDIEEPRIPFQDFRLRAINRFSDKTHLLEAALPGNSEAKFARVRIVWLNETILQANEIENLAPLLIEEKSYFLYPYPSDKAHIAILGPSNSGTLTQMIHSRAARDDPWLETNVRIINYQATAANDYIKFFNYQENHIHESFQWSLQQSVGKLSPELAWPLIANGDQLGHGIAIERTGCSDYELCQALLSEATRRKPFFLSRLPRMVVFYEADTFYGRALALTMETLAKFPSPAKVTEQSEKLLSRLPFSGKDGQAALFNVDLIGYFRGLDGFSSYYRKNYVSSQSSVSNDGLSAAAASSAPKDGLDRAEGSSQFDYLSRTINGLSQSHPPCAVALFGTDVFDKISLLKLLRETLPDALYLSTQLDALYFAPGNLSFTRDLIVASPFGLNPLDENGRQPARLVSFRDSNQTSLYVALTNAVLDVRPSSSTASRPAAQLYEIGDHGPIKLESSPQSLKPFEAVKQLAHLWLEALVTISAIVFLVWGIHPTIVRARDFPDELCGPLKAALRSQDLRDCLDRWSDLKKFFRERWSEGCASVSAFPPLDEFRSAVKSLANSSLSDRVLNDLAEFEIQLTKSKNSTDKGNNLPWPLSQIIEWLNHRFRIGREKNAFRRLKQCLENVFLDERYVDVQSFKELDALRRYRQLPKPRQVWLEAGFVTLVALLFFVICQRIAPYSWGLVGFELRTSYVQYLRALFGVANVWLILWVTYIVCREQFVCDRLIRRFAKYINSVSGLTSRQTIFVIAFRSDSISKLFFYPCSLLFLLFVAHMRPLHGAPTTAAHLILTIVLLSVLCISFYSVRSAATGARESCRQEYEIDILSAQRSHATLASVIDHGKLPIQDDLQRVVDDVTLLGKKNSLSTPSGDVNYTLKARDLNIKDSREAVQKYLESLIERNREVIAFITSLKSGALSSLFVNPLIAALLIPLGGAGGLSVLDYLAKLFRA
jgi:hypothetical protein